MISAPASKIHRLLVISTAYNSFQDDYGNEFLRCFPFALQILVLLKLLFFQDASHLCCKFVTSLVPCISLHHRSNIIDSLYISLSSFAKFSMDYLLSNNLTLSKSLFNVSVLLIQPCHSGHVSQQVDDP